MSDVPEWRPSTRQEIQQYYEQVFPKLVDDLPGWLSPNGPKQYAVAFRQQHPAVRANSSQETPPKDFIRRDTRSSKNPDQTFISSWEEVVSFFQQPAACDPWALASDRANGLRAPDHPEAEGQPRPVPAAVYASLDHWERFWVLAFDIDAKDHAKQAVADTDETPDDVSDEALQDAGILEAAPAPTTLPADQATGSPSDDPYRAVYKYRFEDLQAAIDEAFTLAEWLSDVVEFSDTRVFYSGQGAHVYALDSDPLHKFTFQSRRFLTTYIKEKLDIWIDDAVTWDQSRVIRVPYSLHTDVNRVVTELDSPDFDVRTDPVPGETNPAMQGGVE